MKPKFLNDKDPETVEGLCNIMRDYILERVNRKIISDINFTFYFKGKGYFEQDRIGLYINCFQWKYLTIEEIAAILKDFEPMFIVQKIYGPYNLEKRHEYLNANFDYSFDGWKKLQDNLNMCKVASFLKEDGRHFVTNTFEREFEE